jgi:flagellar biosynthesis repressor protein FlbT
MWAFGNEVATMTLRFDLGPFDQLFIGKCVLKNSHERAYFTVEGHMPILQGKDVLSPERAATALEKLYCCVQKMYLDETHEEHQGSYLALAARSLTDNPSLGSELQFADQLITSRQYYKALRVLKKLIGSKAFKRDETPPENYVPRHKGWKTAV